MYTVQESTQNSISKPKTNPFLVLYLNHSHIIHPPLRQLFSHSSPPPNTTHTNRRHQSLKISYPYSFCTSCRHFGLSLVSSRNLSFSLISPFTSGAQGACHFQGTCASYHPMGQGVQFEAVGTRYSFKHFLNLSPNRHRQFWLLSGKE